MTLEELTPSQIKQLICQLPETRWVQNLRHPAYLLRQPVPVLVEKADDAVTATYDDGKLCGTGESVEMAILDLCAKIVAHYEALQENGGKSHDYMFLRQIIEEIQPPAWEEFKQLYQEQLKVLPYVRKGYINIDGKNADVILILSAKSVERFEQLAQIHYALHRRFKPLSFHVEYERSTDELNLDGFERFYSI